MNFWKGDNLGSKARADDDLFLFVLLVVKTVSNLEKVPGLKLRKK